jgi:hypothetical protein
VVASGTTAVRAKAVIPSLRNRLRHLKLSKRIRGRNEDHQPAGDGAHVPESAGLRRSDRTGARGTSISLIKPKQISVRDDVVCVGRPYELSTLVAEADRMVEIGAAQQRGRVVRRA